MISSNTLRELLWENPMILEATRTVRRTLRAGSNNENPAATRNLNRFLLGTLVFSYLWSMYGIVQSGEDLSVFLIGCEAVLLTLLIPGSLYGAIASEREKLTYESLIMTRLTPAQIVYGKLWWRVGLIVGLMALFLPLIAVARAFSTHGHLDFTDAQIVWTQIILFTWSLCIGSFSLWVSAKSKKGITALLSIVATLLVFLALIPSLISLFHGYNSDIRLYDPFGSSTDYSHYDVSMDIVNTHRRLLALQLIVSLLVSMNPFVMLTTLNHNWDVQGTVNGLEFWQYQGVNYWGVGIFALLTIGFTRGAVKILRGLEMPTREKPVKNTFKLTFGKRGA